MLTVALKVIKSGPAGMRSHWTIGNSRFLTFFPKVNKFDNNLY